MTGRFKARTLIIILAALIALAVVSYLIDKMKGDSSFKTELVSIDTAKVTAISIFPKTDKNNPIKFQRTANKWQIEINGKWMQADENMVSSMLNDLSVLKPERVAATKKEKWAQFEITDSAGTRVMVEAGKEIVANVVIGKFTYQQLPGASQNPYGGVKISSYVRLADENEVYAVDGFLSMTFNRNRDDFRNKSLINENSTDWTKLTFTYQGDSSFVLNKENDMWTIGGLPADSLSVKQFLNTINGMRGNTFIDDAAASLYQPVYSLKVEGKNMQALEVIAFAADTVNQYVVSSTLNKEAAFSSAKDNLVPRLFVSKNTLMNPPPATENTANLHQPE